MCETGTGDHAALILLLLFSALLVAGIIAVIRRFDRPGGRSENEDRLRPPGP